MKNVIFSLVLILALAGCAPAVVETPEEMPPAPMEGGDVLDKNDDDIVEVPEEDEQGDYILNNKLVFAESADFPDAKGEGFYGVREGETRLYASFMVEQTEEDYFYEGWLICGGEVVSTGELVFFDGLYENVFVSSDVPENCEQYILTLEPNDGDPAPAEHILEGTVEGVAHTEDVYIEWDDERFEV